MYARHEASWILPLNIAKHVKYNPRHLPVVQIMVVRSEVNVALWEFTGTNYDNDKRVLAVERPNEDFYLHMSVDRINRGHRVFTPTPLPPSVPFVK